MVLAAIRSAPVIYCWELTSTLISTCKKMSAVIEKYDIKYLYPGHYFGMNKETPQRVKDMITMSEDILFGKVQGEPNPSGMLGLGPGVYELWCPYKL